MDLLKLLGLVGGGTTVIATVAFYLFVPNICEPSTTFFITEYDCFGLGQQSLTEWALILGGATAGVVTLVTALQNKQH